MLFFLKLKLTLVINIYTSYKLLLNKIHAVVYMNLIYNKIYHMEIYTGKYIIYMYMFLNFNLSVSYIYILIEKMSLMFQKYIQHMSMFKNTYFLFEVQC